VSERPVVVFGGALASMRTSVLSLSFMHAGAYQLKMM